MRMPDRPAIIEPAHDAATRQREFRRGWLELHLGSVAFLALSFKQGLFVESKRARDQNVGENLDRSIQFCRRIIVGLS